MRWGAKKKAVCTIAVTMTERGEGENGGAMGVVKKQGSERYGKAVED